MLGRLWPLADAAYITITSSWETTEASERGTEGTLREAATGLVC